MLCKTGSGESLNPQAQVADQEDTTKLVNFLIETETIDLIL